MKKMFLLNVLLIMTVTLFGQTDEDLIKKTITDSYVIGIHNGGTIEAINKGFHPGFELLGIGQDGNIMTKLPIYTWTENIRQAKEAGRVPSVKTECKFLNIDITGNAAMAKIELHREGKLIFTDYLFLYKFKDSWKIVNKIYFRH
ncbi:MAG TPA: hypothetical protein DF637_00025 [Rikenellaceae bacterium]|nr:hypothetical protein [Rikenellaceae bacterium]